MTPTNSIMLADHQEMEGLVKLIRVLLPSAIKNCKDTYVAERLYGIMVTIDNHLDS